MNPKFKLGDIVWYQLPFEKGKSVKARITSVGRIGITGAPCYSIQRFDDASSFQTHHVLEAHLLHAHDTTIPPQPYLTNRELPHV